MAPPCPTGLLIVIEILRVKRLDFLGRKMLVNTLAADTVRLIYHMHTCGVSYQEVQCCVRHF